MRRRQNRVRLVVKLGLILSLMLFLFVLPSALCIIVGLILSAHVSPWAGSGVYMAAAAMIYAAFVTECWGLSPAFQRWIENA